MVGNRLVFLAMALLVGCGRERPGNAAGDDSTRDLQRPAVDASAPMNDRAVHGQDDHQGRCQAGPEAGSQARGSGACGRHGHPGQV